MASRKTIEIDLDVHKKIEGERASFDEEPNKVLRRLLGIDSGQTYRARTPSNGALRAWSSDGVTLPHGTKVRMKYNGRLHEGAINDGKWIVEGQEFSSPSGAAGGVATTRNGSHPSLDGWGYWHAFIEEEGRWVLLSELRS